MKNIFENLKFAKNSPDIGAFLGRTIIILFVIGFSLDIYANDQEDPLINLDWPRIAGARGYQLEFTRGSSRELFSSDVNNWSGALPPGRYEFRIRSQDNIGAPGPWSAKIPLLIRIPIVVLQTPRKNVTVESRSLGKHKIGFSWQAMKAAATYKVEVFDSSKNKVVEESVRKPKAEFELDVAKGYSWSVVALSKEGDEGEKMEVPWTFELKGGRLPKPRIAKFDLSDDNAISWKSSKKTEYFDVVLQQKVEGKKRFKILAKSSDVKTSQFEFDKNLPSGKYRLKVRAKARKYGNSPFSSKIFEFKKFDDPVLLRVQNSGLLLGIEYAPFKRNFNIVSSQVDIAVSQSVLNSWRLHINYQNVKWTNDFGIGLFLHNSEGSLFSEEGADGQQIYQNELRTEALDFGFKVWNDFRFWGALGLHVGLEVVKRKVFSLYADSLTSFGLIENETTEAVVNGGTNVRLSERIFLIGRLGYGYPFQGTRETEDFGHVLGAIGLDQWFSSRLKMGYTYDYSNFSFKASPPNGTEKLEFKSIHHSLGFNFSYFL